MAFSNKKSSNQRYKQIPANPIRLIFEVLLCIVLLLPAVLWATIKLFFKPRQKNIKGQVVLVSVFNIFIFYNILIKRNSPSIKFFS